MDSATLKLEVTTPKGVVLSTEASAVTAPSVSGEFGVMPGHVPLLAAMRPGLLTYRIGQQEMKAAVKEGFVEAGANKVLILTEAFAQKADLQSVDVKAELQRAEADMQSYHGEVDEPEFKKRQAQLLWAKACALVSDT